MTDRLTESEWVERVAAPATWRPVSVSARRRAVTVTRWFAVAVWGLVIVTAFDADGWAGVIVVAAVAVVASASAVVFARRRLER